MIWMETSHPGLEQVRLLPLAPPGAPPHQNNAGTATRQTCSALGANLTPEVSASESEGVERTLVASLQCISAAALANSTQYSELARNTVYPRRHTAPLRRACRTVRQRSSG